MKIRKYRWVACLLVCAMVLGMWNGNVVKGKEASLSDPVKGEMEQCQEITEVNIKIDKPISEQALADTASIEECKVKNILSENQSVIGASKEIASVDTVTIEDIKWFKDKDDQLLSKEEKADYNTEYTVKMVLVSGNGYQFNTENLTIKINNGEVGANNIELDNTGGKATVKYTFPKTKKGSIARVFLTLPKLDVGKKFPKPAICEIDTDKVEIADNGITWKEVNRNVVETSKPVAYGTEYEVYITLKPKENYEFSESGVDIYINKEPPKNYKCDKDDATVTVCYQFEITDNESIKKVVINQISEPVAGGKLADKVSVKEGKVDVDKIVWTEIDTGNKVETADYDTEYMVSITLKPQDKCQFNEHLTVEINGSEGQYNNKNNEVIVSKEFGKTKKKLVENVSLKEIPAPQAGQALVDTASVEERQEANATVENITWWKISKNDGVRESVEEGQIAEYDTDYEVDITLKPGNKCQFSEDLKVRMGDLIKNGFTPNGDGTVTVSYRFPKTEIRPKSKLDQLATPTASPVPPTYTLTLNPNKGALSKQTIHFTVDEISKVSLPTPTRKGYKFIGWYNGKNRVEKITEAKNVTLKAQWVQASIDLKYQSTLTWSKYLSPDVKLTKSVIEKKYTKYVKLDQKKGTMEGKKYIKKAKVTLTINGKPVDVTVKRLSPKPKVKIVKAGNRIPYAIGVYRTFKLSYKHEPGATRAVAEYSYKKKSGFKKCVKELNTLKGGSVSVKKGKKAYFRVTVYYGKYKSSKSELVVLKG